MGARTWVRIEIGGQVQESRLGALAELLAREWVPDDYRFYGEQALTVPDVGGAVALRWYIERCAEWGESVGLSGFADTDWCRRIADWCRKGGGPAYTMVIESEEVGVNRTLTTWMPGWEGEAHGPVDAQDDPVVTLLHLEQCLRTGVGLTEIVRELTPLAEIVPPVEIVRDASPETPAAM